MKEKIMFICRWLRLKYFYMRFKMERNERRKNLFRLAAKEEFKRLYR